MPIWAFVLLTIILILLIAAAVIIPVTLIVLPKNSSPTAASRLSSCTSAAPCAHGGTNVLVSGSCRCICSNGFTGSTCTLPGDSSCTSTDIPSNGTTYHNATLGATLPRLLSAAQKNFTLPLSSQILLSLFSAQNLTCNSQNALVSFPSSSQRRSLPLNNHLEAAILAPLPLLIPTSTLPPTHPLFPRLLSTIFPNAATAAPTADPTAGIATSTSNGIVFAITPAASAPTSTSTSPSPAYPSSSPSNHNSVVTPLENDFAREVVLFVFQEKDLNTAVAAQAKLALALQSAEQGQTGLGYNMSAMDAGGNIVVDFQRFTVDLGNGTLFGGGPT